MEKNQFQTDNQVINPASTTYLIPTNDGYQDRACRPLARSNCCHGALERAEQTAKYDEMDLYSLKPNVKVDFEETFQEPTGSENIQMVWKYNKAIYTWTSRGFYIFLSGLLGPILGIAWGLVFAIMNFVLVWLVNPALKVVLQACRIVEILTRGMVRSSLDPIFQSFGQVFSSLKGKFTLSVPGLEGLALKKESGSDNIKPPTNSV